MILYEVKNIMKRIGNSFCLLVVCVYIYTYGLLVEQAYTMELEAEVSHLKEENMKLLQKQVLII